MGAVRPYPHFEINVKDNSIANVSFEEILPVHRPLWPMPTQKGRVGVPVWCNSYSAARNEFGEQTFKPASKYFSRQAAFLLDTLTYNGAFIYRIVDETAKYSICVVEAYVDENAEIVKYAVDENGNYKYNEDGERVPEYSEIVYETYSEDVVEDQTYGDDVEAELVTLPGGNVITYNVDTLVEYPVYFDETSATWVAVTGDVPSDKLATRVVVPVVGSVKYYINTVVDAADKETVLVDDNGTAEEAGNTLINIVHHAGDYILDEKGEKIIDTEASIVATEIGMKIAYKTRNGMNAGEMKKYGSDYDAWLNDLDVREVDGVKIYPVIAFIASNPGLYGDDLAFQLSYKLRENNKGDAGYFKSIFYTFAPKEREYGTTTVNPHYDKYGREFVSFAANPDAIDKDTGLIYSMENMCNRSYEADGYLLPYTVYTYEDRTFNRIGNRIIKNSLAKDNTGKYLCIDELMLAKDEADGFLVMNEDGTYSVDEDYIDSSKLGYMINILSGYNLDGTEYTGIEIDRDSTDSIILADDENHFLTGGSDGVTNADGSIPDTTILTGIQNLCHVKSFLQIVDKAHYPITHMYDAGYDMKTKYAMLDFLDIRDDIGVSLSTQVLFDNGSGRSISVNDQAADEANGEALRAYALLMRESIVMGTDCCRAAIYCHCGQLAAGNYLGIMPFTYWDAHQHAMYGRTQYMSVTEPRGLPLSYNDLFRISTVNWTNYSPDGQSRVWDTGLNYCQYADMSRIHFPALRTVYRAETSVLVDQWFVDAVIYTKHVVRKAWARHSGRNDSTAVLQAAIKNYLDTELTNLYAGKYTFEVTVYQTEEEKAMGYVQHVKVKLTSGAQFRVLVVDIEVNREGFDPEA